jgi:hypothetical protein
MLGRRVSTTLEARCVDQADMSLRTFVGCGNFEIDMTNLAGGETRRDEAHDQEGRKQQRTDNAEFM